MGGVRTYDRVTSNESAKRIKEQRETGTTAKHKGRMRERVGSGWKKRKRKKTSSRKGQDKERERERERERGGERETERESDRERLIEKREKLSRTESVQGYTAREN